MKYFIGTDHAGINIKPYVIELLEKRGYEVEDLGCYSNDRVDYPDYAHKVAEAVLANPGSKGVLICGSGIGMSLAANKHTGIRAALCQEHYTAKMASISALAPYAIRFPLVRIFLIAGWVLNF
jgi:ribose 5-phosphate isomerase B